MQTRRTLRGRFVRVLAVLLAVVCVQLPATASAQGSFRAAAPEDAVAEICRQALLRNTPIIESTWDAAAGSYRIQDFWFAGVLGNAVLLKYGQYDESLAGVSAPVLRDHTLRTIQKAAAQSRWVSASGTWGGRIYWDSTFESYFVAAAKLMWSELDATTRTRIDTIIRGSANHVLAVGTGDADGWSTNGLAGGYSGDSKIEEMGARSMPLAVGMAWLPSDSGAGQWREWHTRWMSNMNGLPPADRANSTVLNGRPVSGWNTARNIWDTFLVENHGSFAPMYQQSAGAYPGRNVLQFLLAGRPVPQEILQTPNSEPLWEAMARLGTDSGVAESFTVADRHHLYGRSLLPITAQAMLAGDRYAARAERMLADRLIPYVKYAPAGRLTKFSGEAKYEPEARAEVAIAYLLHIMRDQLHGDVTPVSQEEYYARFSASVDFGTGPGLISHSTTRSLAAAVTKPGYTKFAYLPQHDDWLFDVAGKSAALLPSVDLALTAQSRHTYTRLRDGIDASATTVRTSSGAAGFTTLPDGSVVYATTGIGAGEGRLGLYNLNMPGIPGLDGTRRFTWAGGSADLAAGIGDGGVDDVRFGAEQARYVRMFGERAATQFGFSLWEMAVHSGAGGNLALGRPTTASSADPAFPAARATDGNPATRWAVATAQRPNPGWLMVDLGSVRSIDRVVLNWESAHASQYRVEVSTDGQNWRTAAATRRVTVDTDWVNADGRAGFVVRGGTNPITVAASDAVLSDGPATGSAGVLIEGYPAETPAQTAAHVSAPTPHDMPAGLVASLAGGHLSIFNLTTAAANLVEFTVPQPTTETVLYQGIQRIAAGDTSRYSVAIGGTDSRVTPARFTAADPSGAPLPASMGVTVLDSRTVSIVGATGVPASTVRLRSLSTGEIVTVTVNAGQTVLANFGGLRTPTADLARDRTTFPTSPLPPGMTSPRHAVDGDTTTSWVPGAVGRRMVVDLGSVRPVGAVLASWTAGSGSQVRFEVSNDGLTYTAYTSGTMATARYVAAVATAWQPGDGLTELRVLGAGDGGSDQIRLDAASARYVRMYGERAATQYGFSLWEMAVHSGAGGNLALGRPTTASSADPAFPAARATDGNPATRWAVDTAQRPNPGWLMVDLGSVQPIDKVVLNWETAHASHYRIEVSTDGQTWRTVGRVPDPTP